MKEDERVNIDIKEEDDYGTGHRICRLIVKFTQEEKENHRDICEQIERQYSNWSLPASCKEVANQIGLQKGLLKRKVLKEYDEELKKIKNRKKVKGSNLSF